MNRRKFIKTAGAVAGGAAATTLAAPAIAESMPSLKWRITSSFPQALDTLYGGTEVFAKYVTEATDGKFQVQAFPAGEIVPGLQVADKVTDGTVEMGQTALYYFWGKDPAFSLATSIPFGLNARQMNAWWYHGGAKESLNKFFEKYKFIAFAAGNTGCQMGGWFRKPVNSLDDMKGLKFRIGGMGGKIIAKIGVVPQLIAGGDIYPSLEKGTIDACEWVGPYDDEKLGFYKVAPYYYYPGWWEPGPMLHVIVNLDKWNSLPKGYQKIVEAAAGYANADMMAKYDAANLPALRRLVANGAKLSPFSQDILEASFKAANDTYKELSAQSADFKNIYESLVDFRRNAVLWDEVAENTYNNFMAHKQRSNAL
jgi:TRAP-type mannitol/chloroaromatic compound transport system substrate-binding protein